MNVTARRLTALNQALTPREWAVLRTLRLVRVATAAQLGRLHCSHAAQATDRHCRRVLASMHERRLIHRLDRRIGGVRAGSSGWVYALDVAGQRLLNAPGMRRKPTTPGLPFLRHSLAVTEMFVRFCEASASGPPTLQHFATEPDCWRSFSGPSGARLTLKPDAWAVVAGAQFEDHFFIELDLATASPATVSRKCALYRQYWQTGREQASRGVFPHVLWVVPNEQRRSALVDVISRQPAEAWPLFRVVQIADAVSAIRGASS